MGEDAQGSAQVIGMLRADHGHIKDLMARLRSAADKAEQDRVLAELFLDLRILSVLEQQFFYPSLAPVVDQKQIAELGKELYFMLTLMLELESTYASEAPLESTLALLSERFEQHVHKDEGLFRQMEKWAVDWRSQLASMADRMETYRIELKQKLCRKLTDCRGESRFQPPFSIRRRCA
ncbi:MAG: hemerythrin domain-containing protein [Candidatus Obscuribacterales bacterium]|nr:MAG: hemerythrin domain-containing protein [Candidatus Melainabacteria bacterium]